jgi:hypothetical protein
MHPKRSFFAGFPGGGATSRPARANVSQESPPSLPRSLAHSSGGDNRERAVVIAGGANCDLDILAERGEELHEASDRKAAHCLVSGFKSSNRQPVRMSNEIPGCRTPKIAALSRCVIPPVAAALRLLKGADFDAARFPRGAGGTRAIRRRPGMAAHFVRQAWPKLGPGSASLGVNYGRGKLFAMLGLSGSGPRFGLVPAFPAGEPRMVRQTTMLSALTFSTTR